MKSCTRVKGIGGWLSGFDVEENVTSERTANRNKLTKEITNGKQINEHGSNEMWLSGSNKRNENKKRKREKQKGKKRTG